MVLNVQLVYSCLVGSCGTHPFSDCEENIEKCLHHVHLSWPWGRGDHVRSHYSLFCYCKTWLVGRDWCWGQQDVPISCNWICWESCDVWNQQYQHFANHLHRFCPADDEYHPRRGHNDITPAGVSWWVEVLKDLASSCFATAYQRKQKLNTLSWMVLS